MSTYTIIQTELRTVVNAMFTKPLCCEDKNLPVRGWFEDQRSFLSKILRLAESKYEHADVVHSPFLNYPAEFRKLSTFFDGMCGIVCDGLHHQEVEGKIQGFRGLLLWKWS